MNGITVMNDVVLVMAKVDTSNVQELGKQLLLAGLILGACYMIFQCFVQKKHVKALITFLVAAVIFAFINEPTYYLERIGKVAKVIVDMFQF